MEPSCSKNEHVVGLFAHHALTTNNNEKSSWIVDSGAICHMCHDIDKFINMKKLDKAEDIILGDGHSVKAFGIRTVDLNVRASDEKQQRLDYLRHYMFRNYLTICLVYLRLPDQENRLHSQSHVVIFWMKNGM